MRIVVVGNAATDEFLTVDAWPSPGMSVLAESGLQDLGGKGANQAIMLARCGIEVRLVTCVGRDEAGDAILSALAEEGVSFAGRQTDACATDRSVVLIGPLGENAIVTTVGCAGLIGPDEIDAAAAASAPGDGLLLQGNLSVELTGRTLERARQRGLRTAFNPSPVRTGFPGLLGMVHLLIVNAHEATALSGASDVSSAVDKLLSLGAGTVVVTLGADGVAAATGTQRLRVPARKVTVCDTTGAGDTFAGVLVASWLREEIVSKANLEAAVGAAAVTVGRAGTRGAFPTPDELSD